MRREPTATLVSHDDNATLWCVQWPSSGSRWGKTYYATTYADSDALLIQTAAKRQVASVGVAKKLEPAVRLAIATAKARWELK